LIVSERAPFTHPVLASLNHPLFACGGKEGEANNLDFITALLC